MDDFTLIIDWLKNTAIGIIILGAIGSILAFYFLWLVKYIINVVGHHRKKNGCLNLFAFRKLQSENDVFKINIFYSFHSVSLVIWLLLSIIFFDLFFIMVALSTSKNELLSLSIYIPILLAFSFLISAYFEYNNIRRWYLAVMNPIFNKAIESHQNNKGQQ